MGSSLGTMATTREMIMMQRNKKFINSSNLRQKLKKLQQTDTRLDEKDALPKEDDTSPVLKEIQEIDHLISESVTNRQ